MKPTNPEDYNFETTCSKRFTKITRHFRRALYKGKVINVSYYIDTNNYTHTIKRAGLTHCRNTPHAKAKTETFQTKPQTQCQNKIIQLHQQGIIQTIEHDQRNQT